MVDLDLEPYNSIMDLKYESQLRLYEFDVYFEHKKSGLINDMKSFGETHRLPRMLVDMDRVKDIYKEYFDAGFTACLISAIKEIGDLTKSNEVYGESVDDLLEENSRLKLRCTRYEGMIQDLESRLAYLESEKQVKYLGGTLMGNY